MSPWMTALLVARSPGNSAAHMDFPDPTGLAAAPSAFPSPMAVVGELSPHRSDHGQRDGVSSGACTTVGRANRLPLPYSS